MASCAGINAQGNRCKTKAMQGSSWCFNHSPDHEEARRQRASKGGRRGGRGRPLVEVAELREQLEELYELVLSGETEPKVGTVLNQVVNTRARLIDTALRAREQEVLEQRVQELEDLLDDKKQKAVRWG